MTPLETFAATLTPGTFTAYPCPSLLVPYDGVSKVFEPSQAAKAEAKAAGWNALHMADWWSHLAHDAATDSYWIAGGRDRAKASPQNLVSYHAGTDTWTHRPAWSGASGGHCYQSSCVGGGKFYYATSITPNIETFDLATNAYAGSLLKPDYRICVPHSSNWNAGTALAFAPWWGASGSLIWVNCNSNTTPTNRISRIARYDFAQAKWLSVYGFRGDLWNNGHLIALPSRHAQIVLVGATSATEQKTMCHLDASGALTPLPIGPMSINVAGTGRGMVVEHPERQEWIVFCLSTKRIWSLPPGGVWTDRGPVPLDLQGQNCVAMPMSFGAAFVKYAPAGSTMTVWKPDF